MHLASQHELDEVLALLDLVLRIELVMLDLLKPLISLPEHQLRRPLLHIILRPG